MLIKRTTTSGILILYLSSAVLAQNNLLSIAASLFSQVPTSAYDGIVSAAQSAYSQAISPASAATTTTDVISTTPSPSATMSPTISIASTSSFVTTTFSTITTSFLSTSLNQVLPTATTPTISSLSFAQAASSTVSVQQVTSVSSITSTPSAATPSTSSHHIGNSTIIALAVVCSLLGVALLAAILYLCWRRRSKRTESPTQTDDIETWRLGASRRTSSKHVSNRSYSSSGGFVAIPILSTEMTEATHNRTHPSTLTRYSSRGSVAGDSVVSPIEPDMTPTWSSNKRVSAIAEEREAERESLGSPTSPAEMEGSSIPWIAQKMSRMGRQHQHQQSSAKSDFSEFDFGLAERPRKAEETAQDTFRILRRPIK